MSRFAIIADDLTGASDTGIKLKLQGIDVDVVFDIEEIDAMLRSRRILAINTSSREDTPEAARKKLIKLINVLKENGCDRVYKKIDSVFRGNVGAEIEVLMETLDVQRAFLAPAIPANKRIIRDGSLYVNHGEESSLDICWLLQKTSNLQVEKITLEDLEKGKEWVLQNLLQYPADKKVVVLFDTVTDDDFRLITAVFKAYPGEYLPVGASGMANFLPDIWGLAGEGEKFNLIVIGSYHKITGQQLKYLLAHSPCGVITVDTRKAVQDPRELGRVLQEARHLLSGAQVPETLVVTVDTALEAAKFPLKKENAFIIASFLSRVAREIVSSGRCETITISGGETAYHVMGFLGAKGMRLIDEIASGIPVGIVLGGMAEGLPLITKSGGFGECDAFVQILNYFKK